MSTAENLSQRRDELVIGVRRFLAAFNDLDLDGSVAMFAEDALYRTFEGVERRGRAAIRRELAPQFRGVYGRISFEELELLVDPVSARAALRWRCVHDLSVPAQRGIDDLRRRAWRALYGDVASWEGADILHLGVGGACHVSAKHTYAKARLPRTRRGS